MTSYQAQHTQDHRYSQRLLLLSQNTYLLDTSAPGPHVVRSLKFATFLVSLSLSIYARLTLYSQVSGPFPESLFFFLMPCTLQLTLSQDFHSVSMKGTNPTYLKHHSPPIPPKTALCQSTNYPHLLVSIKYPSDYHPCPIPKCRIRIRTLIFLLLSPLHPNLLILLLFIPSRSDLNLPILILPIHPSRPTQSRNSIVFKLSSSKKESLSFLLLSASFYSILFYSISIEMWRLVLVRCVTLIPMWELGDLLVSSGLVWFGLV
jgi:hypothetical protein